MKWIMLVALYYYNRAVFTYSIGEILFWYKFLYMLKLYTRTLTQEKKNFFLLQAAMNDMYISLYAFFRIKPGFGLSSCNCK